MNCWPWLGSIRRWEAVGNNKTPGKTEAASQREWPIRDVNPTLKCALPSHKTIARRKARKDQTMKTKAIATLLLCIVTAAQPAFTAIPSKRTEDRPLRETDSTRSPTGEMVVVAQPFSFFQVTPSLVEYLEMTATQVKSIQELIEKARPTAERLMLELRAINRERTASQQGQNNDTEGDPPRLAASQTRLLKQLMRANWSLQKRINDVLNPRQRKKLESMRRMSEVTVGGD
jgi:hypothetical protein